VQIGLRLVNRIGVRHPPPVRGRPDCNIFCNLDVFTRDRIRWSAMEWREVFQTDDVRQGVGSKKSVSGRTSMDDPLTCLYVCVE